MKGQGFWQRWFGGSPHSCKVRSRCVVRGAETLERRELLSAVGIGTIPAQTPLDATALTAGANATAKAAGGGGGTTTTHYTYESMKTQLENWAKQFGSANGDLVQLVRIGQGAQAYKDPIANDPYPETTRGLWAIKISDHASLTDDGVTQYEPDVKYIGTMHGNEPLGMEMDMRFINELLTNYTKNPTTAEQKEVKTLVDNSEIWVLPLMNPDGFANGTRTNYNGQDLNRSFPDLSQLVSNPYQTSKPTLASLEAGLPKDRKGICAVPEVKAVMDWSSQHQFVLAANFHMGNLLVNYPYDNAVGAVTGTPAISPDDSLYQSLSHIYANDNTYMLNNSPYKTQGGITNGAAWFVASGTMQDFDYRYFTTKHVTIELYPGYDYGTNKNPINIGQQWAYNRQAMLDYLYQGTPMVDKNAGWVATSSATGSNVATQATSQPNTAATSVADPRQSLLAAVGLSLSEQPNNKHHSSLFGEDDLVGNLILSPTAVDMVLAGA